MIPIAKPLLSEAEADAARQAVLSGWVTQGPKVAEFEKAFAAQVGASYACAVSNCTTALHLALLAAGVGPGDEVITASHSFIATANSIRYCGATPIFVDIDRKTFNIDPAKTADAITPKTRAILTVHQMGMPCDMKSLLALSKGKNIALIEDAACAAGSQIKLNGSFETIGRPHGDIACFSFHPRKVITTGDGGMLTTLRADFDAKFRLWRQHGMDVPDTVRHGSPQVIFESYPIIGYNYRMTDIQAAVGCQQVKRLPELVVQRRRIADRYVELLGNIDGLELPHEPEWARSNWQSYCVRLPDRLDQRTVMQHLLDRGISTRRGIMCSHREKAYSSQEQRFDLTQSEQAQDHCIVLPIYAQMTDDEQNRVADALREEIRA